MTTLSNLVNEVSLKLAGYTMRQDRATHLTAAIAADTLVLPVASTDNISKGLIEIDEELMWVDSFDKTSKTLTIAPYGRGYLGTTAKAHADNSKITIAPTIPVKSIKDAINDTILAVDLFTVKSYNFEYNVAVSTYALPSNVESIMSVTYETIGPSDDWKPVRRFDFDKNADPSAFGSTKSITLMSPVEPGRTVRVTYITDAEPLESDSDDFEDTTGLPRSCKDVVIYGACYNLVSFIDPGRATYSSPEADAQSDRIQIGSSTNISKYFYAIYQQRLAEERSKLLAKYPARSHYKR